MSLIYVRGVVGIVWCHIQPRAMCLMGFLSSFCKMSFLAYRFLPRLIEV